MRIRILIGLIYWLIICNFAHCRTPCGCVDWNRMPCTRIWVFSESHPVWVRGLKLKVFPFRISSIRRTPCGCVDWNSLSSSMSRRRCKSHPVWVRGLKPRLSGWTYWMWRVAPRVGAWIETSTHIFIKVLNESHPVWVRGLKPFGFVPLPRTNEGRTPCGCVDWNLI